MDKSADKSAVVLLSGGIDSTTLLYFVIHKGYRVMALSIYYGQRHSRELQCARAITDKLGIRHEYCDLGVLQGLLKGSSQTDAAVDVPEGHYEDPSMRATVVPNRNMILLATGAAAAIGAGIGHVAYAAHAGDHAIYPDCRPKFVNALRQTMRLCHYDGGVELFTPFIHKTKMEIVRLGTRLKVPYEMTFSCYAGREKHCGKCGTCVERREAFSLTGIADPVEYE